MLGPSAAAQNSPRMLSFQRFNFSRGASSARISLKVEPVSIAGCLTGTWKDVGSIQGLFPNISKTAGVSHGRPVQMVFLDTEISTVSEKNFTLPGACQLSCMNLLEEAGWVPEQVRKRL